MTEASKYSIEIRQGNFEGEDCFQARVKELPFIEEYADSHVEAYELCLDTIEHSLIEMREKGKEIPQPIVIDDNYSGRVTLRIPRSLHQYLASAAEIEGVSLNTLMTCALSSYQINPIHHYGALDSYSNSSSVRTTITPHGEKRTTKRTTMRVVGGATYFKEKDVA